MFEKIEVSCHQNNVMSFKYVNKVLNGSVYKKKKNNLGILETWT